MLKTLGVLVGGVFVGAALTEIVHRQYPHIRDSIYGEIRELAAGIRAALREGYQEARSSREPAPALPAEADDEF